MSNVRLQFKIVNNGVTLGTGDNKNRVIVDINDEFHCRAIRVDNNGGLTNDTGTGDRLRKSDGATPTAAAVEIDPSTLETLNIDCKDREEALKVAALINHKGTVKDTGNFWTVWIDNYDYNDDGPFAGNNPKTFLDIDAGGTTLTLKTSGFANGLNSLKISDVNFADTTHPDRTKEDKVTNHIDAAAEIAKILPDATEPAKLVKKLADLDGRYPTPTNKDSLRNITTIQQADIDTLREFVGAASPDIKHTFYNYNTFHNLIDDWITWLEEMIVWKEMGLKNEGEVLQANANTFRISKRGKAAASNPTIGVANVDGDLTVAHVNDPNNLNIKDGTHGKLNVEYLKNKTSRHTIIDGKYRGFKIFNPTQNIDTVTALTIGNPTTNNAHLVLSGLAAVAQPNLNKENINNFRNIWHTKGERKEDFRGFWFSDLIAVVATHGLQAQAGSLANDAKDSTNTQYKGKNIMDKTLEIKGRKDGKKMKADFSDGDLSFKNDQLGFTKTIFDLGQTIEVADKDDVLRILRDSDFDTANGTKKNVLDMCFAVIQDETTAWNNYSYQNDTEDNRKEIIDEYNKYATFLELIDRDYSSKNKDDNKTELENDGNELDSYRDANSGDHHVNYNLTWTDIINKKQAEIRAAMLRDKMGDDDNDEIDAAKITAALNGITWTCNDDEKAAIKKLFDTANHAEIIAGGQKYLTEITNLAKKFDETFTDGTKVAKTDFDHWNQSDDKTNAKKAWKLAEKITLGSQKLTEAALAKAKKEKKDDAAELLAAQAELKKAIVEVLGKADANDEVYDKIVAEIKNSKSEIEEATKILRKAKEIINASSDAEAAKFLNEISTLRGDGTKNAWKAVNKYEINGKGYANTAFERANKDNKENQEVGQQITKDTTTEVKAEIEKVKKTKWYKDNPTHKKLFDEKMEPRALLRAKLKEKTNASTEEIALVALLGDFIKQADLDGSYSDNSNKTNWETLKKKLADLKKYKTGSGKENAAYKSLTSEEKQIIDTLISDLETKTAKMEKEINKKDDNQNAPSKDGSFLNSWKGYLTIALVVLVVVGGIAWLIKANSSSEEGEAE